MEENKSLNPSPRPAKRRPAAVMILLLVLLVAAIVYIFYSRSQFTTLIEHNRKVAMEELAALQADYDTLYVQDSQLKIEVAEAQEG